MKPLAIALGATVLLSSCSMQTERARIPLPSSGLVLVLKEDEKKMARYVFELRGEAVSSEGFLGPGGVAMGGAVEISKAGPVIQVAWGESTTRQFVAIDTVACRIVKHSNSAAAPPSMMRCS